MFFLLLLLSLCVVLNERIYFPLGAHRIVLREAVPKSNTGLHLTSNKVVCGAGITNHLSMMHLHDAEGSRRRKREKKDEKRGGGG